LIGGLFFAGYMLTQFPGGYLGDRYGHRTVIVVSLVWAGIATVLTGFFGGLLAFIVIRVVTGLGEGAYFSNDRTLITVSTPERNRSLGMGVVITGLAIGLTIATVFSPFFIDVGRLVLPKVDAWRMAFWILGGATLVVGLVLAYRFRAHLTLPTLGRATLRLAGYSAVSLVLIMAVYLLGDRAGLSTLWIAVLEVALAVGLVLFALARKGKEIGPVLKNRDLFLIYLANIAILWNLWFFSFWSVSIIAGAAHSSFLNAALTAGFNAGAGILGFPAGGWLSDVAVRHGWSRKSMMLSCTAVAVGHGASAVHRQPVLQRTPAHRARAHRRDRRARAARLGVRHAEPHRRDGCRAGPGRRRGTARSHRELDRRRVAGRGDRRGRTVRADPGTGTAPRRRVR
jgi:MFS family permease